MDPVSHLALGRTLIGVLTSTRSLDARRCGCVVAAVLGALSPDLDAVLMPFGWDRYLRVHQVGTHTMAGTLLCALVTATAVHAFVVSGFSRTARVVVSGFRRTARIDFAGSAAEYSSLALAAWIGAASHVSLDLLSGARLRLGWPFVDAVASVPLVAMADPWLLALCVAGPVGF
jgi:hypothetical protein